jgi:hypothetical protein
MQIEGYGLKMNLPAGWDGRITRDSPKDAVVLQAASTELAPGDVTGVETHRRMRNTDLYLKVIDIGAPTARLVDHDPAWSREALPIRFGTEHIYDTFEDVELPAYGARAVAVDGHALMVYVGFGSFPSQADVARANAVLASFSVD